MAYINQAESGKHTNLPSATINSIFGANSAATLREFSCDRFAYWGTNKQELRVYDLTAYKKENGFVGYKNSDGNLVEGPFVKNSKVLVWGYTDKTNNNKFVVTERFFVGSLKEEDYYGTSKSKECKGATVVSTKPANEDMREGVTIVETLNSTLINGPTDDYKNNVINPINNITNNFSTIFNTNVIKLLETKYIKLSKEVSVKDLKAICNKDLGKLKKLINATMINSENLFDNVYGLEELSTKVAALNDKTVAQYVTNDQSIIYNTDIRGYIENSGLPKMEDKIFVDIDKMFMKNLTFGDYKYKDTYGKIYLDDVLIYIINNLDEYYYYTDASTNLYDACNSLCSGLSGNRAIYIKGLLAKIKYLIDLKTTMVSENDKKVYNTYLKDMSYAGIYNFATKEYPANPKEYIDDVSSITTNLLGKVGNNETLKNIVSGFDAYLKEFGSSEDGTTYSYYTVLTPNITEEANLNTSLSYVFMQNSNNAIANFDIHLDAYQAYYNYWITTGNSGQYSDEKGTPYVNVKGGKGFLTARGCFSSIRLAVDQNTYTGYDGKDKWSDSRQNDNNNNILGSRSDFADFNILAKNDRSNLVKSVIPYTENGIRYFAAKVTYSVSKLYEENEEGIHTDNVYDGTSATYWENAAQVNYDTRGKDTYYYSSSRGNSIPINVYTPIYVLPYVKTSLVKTENQKIPASKFEMKFSQKIENTSKYYNVKTEDATRDVYYVRFNFDVFDVKYTSASDINKVVNLNGTIKKGTWIGPINSYGPKDDKGNVTSGVISGAVSGLGGNFDSSYDVLAIQHTVGNDGIEFKTGARDNLTRQLMSYSNVEAIIASDLKDKLDNICIDRPEKQEYNKDDIYTYSENNALKLGTYYIHHGVIDFQLQIYDFKVTDVTDPSWKSTFRNENNGYTHSERAYYSGTRSWNYMAVENGLDVSFINRDQSELGDFSNNILPIGPYKNSKLTYAYAPKLRIYNKF